MEATLTIAPGSLAVSPAPRQGCDAMAVGRGIVLTNADTVDPDSVTVELEDTLLFSEDD